MAIQCSFAVIAHVQTQ